MKYLTATSLASGVKMHYGQHDPSSLAYKQIVFVHQNSVMEFKHVQADFHRGMKCVMLDWGWVIKTTLETTDKDIINETLVSHDSRTAVITAREVIPANPGGTCRCLRDDDYPIGSIVRLARARKPCADEIMGRPPF